MIRKSVLLYLGDEKFRVGDSTPVTDSDFTVRTEGGTFFLTPDTSRAESWSVNRLATFRKIDRAYVIFSTTDFANTVNAIIDAGFIVEERRRIDANWRFGKDRVREPSVDVESDDDEYSGEWNCEVLLDKYRTSGF